MAHWAKFAEAERDISQLIESLSHTGTPASKLYGMTAGMALSILQTGERFYLPDAIDMFKDRELDPEIKQTVKLPYQTMSILSESYINDHDGKRGGERERTWNITCVMVPPREFVKMFGNVEGIESVDQLFMVFSVTLQDGVWIPFPLPCCMTSVNGETGYRGHMMPDNGTGIDRIIRQHIKNLENVPALHYSDDLAIIINLCAVLNTRNCKVFNVDVPPKLAKRREQRGNLPLSSYHVLEVDGEVWDSPHTKGDGTHGSRSHLRRGHIRRLGPDHTVWVRHAFVHGKLPGFVNKDYEVVSNEDPKQTLDKS